MGCDVCEVWDVRMAGAALERSTGGGAAGLVAGGREESSSWTPLSPGRSTGGGAVSVRGDVDLRDFFDGPVLSSIMSSASSPRRMPESPIDVLREGLVEGWV